MIRSLWIAKTGLEAQQAQMDVITNNLANVGTNGFKRSRAVFEDLMYQTARQPGANVGEGAQLPTGLQFGTGARAVATERLHTQGSLQQTGNDKEIAIEGAGFFPIQMPDGTTGYTRDGNFSLNAEGQLVTLQGYQVLPGITVPVDANSLSVSKSGVVSVVLPGNLQPTELGQIQIASFVNPAGLEAKGENIYGETAASGAPVVNNPGEGGVGTLTQGFVETSNVNVVEELVSMIQAQRAYEINSKAITASDQMLQKIGQL